MMQSTQCAQPAGPGGRALAMVYPVSQRLCSVYDPEEAIQNGTLFPELYKPMMERMMSIDRTRATANQALSFAAWEMRLYLNTHPQDQQALALFQRYCAAAGKPNYACTFALAQGCQTGAWRWLDNPWPWELQDNMETEGNSHVCV